MTYDESPLLHIRFLSASIISFLSLISFLVLALRFCVSSSSICLRAAMVFSHFFHSGSALWCLYVSLMLWIAGFLIFVSEMICSSIAPLSPLSLFVPCALALSRRVPRECAIAALSWKTRRNAQIISRDMELKSAMRSHFPHLHRQR